MITTQRQPFTAWPSPEDAQLQWTTHLDRCDQCRLWSGYCDTGRSILSVTVRTDRARTGGTK